jgi:hypothetical protein
MYDCSLSTHSGDSSPPPSPYPPSFLPPLAWPTPAPDRDSSSPPSPPVVRRLSTYDIPVKRSHYTRRVRLLQCRALAHSRVITCCIPILSSPPPAKPRYRLPDVVPAGSDSLHPYSPPPIAHRSPPRPAFTARQMDQPEAPLDRSD